MRSVTLDPSALTDAQLGRWRELAEQAIEPNPFFEPAPLLGAIAALGRPDVRLIVALGSGGEWRGILPIEIGRGWRRLPLRAVASWTHTYCFLGTPLIDSADPERAMAVLIRGAIGSGGASFIGLDTVGADGPVRQALREVGTSRTVGPAVRESVFLATERAALRRGQEGGYLGLSIKHSREAARNRRRLTEALEGEITTTDRAGEEGAVEEFMRLEQSGWKGRQGTAFASQPGHARYFRDLCREFADAGRLQLLSMETDNRVVAMKCNLRAGHELFCFKIAFDEEFSRWSPGVQLELDNVAIFEQDDTIQLMDSCAHPTNQMINRLWTGRRSLDALTLTRPWRGAVTRPAISAAAAARTKLKGPR